MWFLPSYGRPDVIRRIHQWPGGHPDRIVLVLNEDDAHNYAPPESMLHEKKPGDPEAFIKIVTVPARSRLHDAWMEVWRRFPDEPFYGMLADDMWPRTPDWWRYMEETAGDRWVAYTNGLDTEFPLLRGCCCIGGKLLRVMGGIAPATFRHNYTDCVLNTVAADAGVLRPLAHVHVDHRHWKFDPSVPCDETYLRGSADQADDAARYAVWLGSADRAQRVQRIRQAFG